MKDDNRRAILARRARFVAAALASTGCGGTTAEPRGEPPTEIVVPSANAEESSETDAAPPPRADAGVAQPPEPKKSYPQICLSEY